MFGYPLEMIERECGWDPVHAGYLIFDSAERRSEFLEAINTERASNHKSGHVPEFYVQYSIVSAFTLMTDSESRFDQTGQFHVSALVRNGVPMV